jgi:hypothetical protein
MKINNMSITIEGIDLDVEFYYYPGRPAKLYELPENCYPEEYPEVEIDSVKPSGTDIKIGVLLSEDTFNKIETYILENHDNNERGDYE